MPQLSSNGARKRPKNEEEENLDGEPMTKKVKENEENAEPPPKPMSIDQIKKMMASAKSQIEERKMALASLRGNSGLSNNTTKVPLPPPRLVNVDNQAVNMMENTVASLQVILKFLAK